MGQFAQQRCVLNWNKTLGNPWKNNNDHGNICHIFLTEDMETWLYLHSSCIHCCRHFKWCSLAKKATWGSWRMKSSDWKTSGGNLSTIYMAILGQTQQIKWIHLVFKIFCMLIGTWIGGCHRFNSPSIFAYYWFTSLFPLEGMISYPPWKHISPHPMPGDIGHSAKRFAANIGEGAMDPETGSGSGTGTNLSQAY